MYYETTYHSPIGNLYLRCDGEVLTDIFFEKPEDYVAFAGEIPVLEKTKEWLDIYFAGENPSFMPAYRLAGSSFQMQVWHILEKIPYGQVTTYGAIAEEIARVRGIQKMSAQAIGGAVGRNPLPILVPCHRVVGKDGNLTGFSGGMDKKIGLLKCEHFDMQQFRFMK